jgi:hypothetical protein
MGRHPAKRSGPAELGSDRFNSSGGGPETPRLGRARSGMTATQRLSLFLGHR